MQKTVSAARRRSQGGNFMIEWSLCMVFVLMPIFFGTVFLSLSLGRAMQVETVSRDAANMYARGVDFSINQNKDQIVRLAAGVNITRTGGNGLIYLSQIIYVTDVECAAAGLVPPCANRNVAVITQRQTVGDITVQSSQLAMPTATLDSQGNLSSTEYLTQASARATTTIFGGPSCICLAPLNVGETAYVAEVIVRASEFVMPGFSTSGIYSRTII